MRPTEYNDELARQIASTVSSAPVRLAELCKQRKDWPAKKTIVQWIKQHETFAALMLEAIEARDGESLD